MTDPNDETIEITRSEWEDMQRSMAELREGFARLTARGAPAGDAPATTADPPGPAPSQPAGAMGRRRAMGALAGAAAAGVAGAVVGARPAAAANGDAMILGNESQAATAGTAFAVNGTSAAYGFGVSDNAYTGTPLESTAFFHAKHSNFLNALEVIGEGTARGAYVHSETGTALVAFAQAPNVAQIIAAADTGVSKSPALLVNAKRLGASIAATQTHLLLQSNVASIESPPTRVVEGLKGEIVADGGNSNATDSNLWFCVQSGTPGTWRKLGGLTTAGALHVLPAPVRIYDSRPGTTPAVGSKTPLAANTARTLDLTVNSSTVPKGATAALVTCLLVNAATGNGNFTIWSNTLAKPQANTLVWGPSGGRFTATAVTSLDADAKVKVQASLTTDLVVDVVGYYR